MISEHLASVQGQKRSYKDDKRYGAAWSARFKGRTLDEIAPAELDKIRVDRLKTPPPTDEKAPRKATGATPSSASRTDAERARRAERVAP